MSDDLQIELLQKILKELQGTSVTEGSRARRERQALRGAGAQGASARELETYEKEITLLNQKKETLDGLSRSEELRLRQIEQSMDLRRQLAAEEQKLADLLANNGEVYLAQLEKLNELEKEQGKLTDSQIRRKKLLQRRMAGTSKEAAELTNELNNLTKAQNDLADSLELGAGKFENLSGRLFEINGEAERFSRLMPLSADEISGFASETIDAVKSGEIFVRLFNKLIAAGFNLSMELDRVNADLSRTTGLFQETGTIMDQQARIIRDVERSNAELGVTTAETGQAMGALQSSMADFTRMSESDQKSILNTATVMQELGISAQTSAQIFDKATKSLGYQNSEIRGIADELHATAQSLGVPFSQIADDFNMVATELAFYGETAIDVFKELSKQSKATGLSMQQLLKIGGQAFNTFDGAAQKVGRLNAILGGPYLNSIDMLNASEAERIDLIKQSMDASGQMFNDLSKYEQMAIADALGVSTEEARRLFGELSTAEEMDIRQKEKMEETARKAQATMDKLANAFNSLIVSLDFVIGPLSFVIELFSKLIATPVGKFIGQVVLYVGGAIGAFMKLGKTLTSIGGKFMKFGSYLKSFGRTKDATLGQKTMGKAEQAMRKFGANAYKIGQTLRSPTKMLGMLRAGVSGVARAFVSAKTFVAGAVVSIVGAISGMFKVFKAGGGAIDYIAGAFIGMADAMSKVLNFLTFDAFDKLIAFTTGGSTATDLLKTVDYGKAAEAIGVDDAIITSKGKIIKPNKQDNIFAAKPGGPIMNAMSPIKPNKQDTIFAAKPGGPIMNAMSPILNLLGGETNNTVNNTSMKQQAPNINVVVKIGEKEIKNMVVDTFLNDREVAAMASSFGGK